MIYVWFLVWFSWFLCLVFRLCSFVLLCYV